MAGSTANRQKLSSSCQRNTIYSKKTILQGTINPFYLLLNKSVPINKHNTVKLPSSWLKSLSLVAQNARIADVSLYENLRFAMFVSHTFD